MFTKIYVKLKQFIKENYKELLIIVGIYALFSISLPYSIYKPGGMINLSDRIESSDEINKSTGSINSTYVSMVKGTIPMLILSKILPSWDIVDNDLLTMDDEDINETIKRDKYYMQEAISNAQLVAYTYSNKEVNIINTKNIVTYIIDSANTNLKLYDNILEYDGIKYTDFDTLKKYINSKNIGDKINFKIIRNDKEMDAYAEVILLEDEKKIGIMSATINEYNNKPNISVKTKSSESGPSGGLMTSLAIYNAINEEDITKGRVIAGTGTIDKDGNVGEIGGVIYKIAGALKNGANVFLCPKDNYEEAIEFTKKEGYDIIIVSVETFADAINYLEME